MQAFHVMRQGGVVLTSVLLAKSALDTSEIGEWELLLFVGYTFSFFWASGLVQGLLTMYPKLEVNTQKSLIFNTYLIFITLSTAIGMALWADDGKWLAKGLNQPELPHIGLYALVMALQLPVYLLENFYLLKDKPGKILGFGIFSGLGQVLSIGIPVWIGEGLEGGLWGLCAFTVIRHIWLLVFVWRNGSFSPDWQLCRKLLVLSAPLMGYSALGGIQIAMAGWLVAWFYPGDSAAFAVYRYGAQELPFAMALSTGLGMAMLPELAKSPELALSEIKVRSLRLFHGLFPVALIIMLSSEWLFPFVFREAFQGSVPVFRWYLLILVTRMIFSRTILIGLEANKAVWWISVAEVIIFGVLGYAFGAVWGLVGIAAATLVTYSLEKVLLCWLLYRKFGIGVSAYTDMRWFAIYACLMVGAWLVGHFGFL